MTDTNVNENFLRLCNDLRERLVAAKLYEGYWLELISSMEAVADKINDLKVASALSEIRTVTYLWSSNSGLGLTEEVVEEIGSISDEILNTYYSNMTNFVYIAQWYYADYDDVREDILGVFETLEDAKNAVLEYAPSASDGKFSCFKYAIGSKFPIRNWTFDGNKKEFI